MNKLKYIISFALFFFVGQAYAQMQGQGGMGGFGGGGGGYNGGQNGGQNGGRHKTDNFSSDDDENGKREKPDAEQMAKMQTAKMQKDLNLTPEQNKQVADINLKYAKQLEEQRQNTPEMTDYTKAVIMKIRKNQSEELKAVLTEEQWQVLQKKQEEAKRQHMYGQ